MPLTPEQEAFYITHLGVRCPICESDNVTTQGNLENMAHAEHIIIQEVTCEDCNAEWQDYYTLSGVELQEDDDV